MSSKKQVKPHESIIKENTSFPTATNTKLSPTWLVRKLKDSPAEQLAIIEKIRTGVTKKEWKDFIMYIEADEKDFKKILPRSISSMQKKDIYNQKTSERIYEIARLFGLGYEVFDSPEKFKNWLFTPSKALGNKKPFDFLDSSLGFNVVENEITRVQYNDYC